MTENIKSTANPYKEYDRPPTIKFSETKYDKRPYRIQTIPELTSLFTRGIPVVFLGGQMSTFDYKGDRFPVADRKKFSQWLDLRGVYHFDPPESRPKNPTFQMCRETDKVGGILSMIDISSVGKESLCAISTLEILFDFWLDQNPYLNTRRILYLPDAQNSIDNFSFQPEGIMQNSDGSLDIQSSSTKALKRHLFEAVRAANLVRAEFLGYAKEAQFWMGDDPKNKIFVVDSQIKLAQLKARGLKTFHITADHLHIAELIEAYSLAVLGDTIGVFFDQIFDENGNPIISQKCPSPEKLDPYDGTFSNKAVAFVLQEYIDVGNKIRKQIVKVVQNDPHTRIVFNDVDAKRAMLACNDELKNEQGRQRN